MGRFISVVAVLVLIGCMPVPTLPAELRVTDFVDNIFPHIDQNTSDGDLYEFSKVMVHHEIASSLRSSQ
jgi:hypothetical protein